MYPYSITNAVGDRGLLGVHCVNRTLRTRAVTPFPGAERGGAGLSIRRGVRCVRICCGHLWYIVARFWSDVMSAFG